DARRWALALPVGVNGDFGTSRCSDGPPPGPTVRSHALCCESDRGGFVPTRRQDFFAGNGAVNADLAHAALISHGFSPLPTAEKPHVSHQKLTAKFPTARRAADERYELAPPCMSGKEHCEG